jgi:hypothetical protein
MPARADVPHVLRFDFGFVLSGARPASCHWFFDYAGAAPTNAQLATMAGVVQAAINTRVTPFMNIANSTESTTITDLTSPTAAQGSALIAAAGAQDTEDTLADVVAFVLQQKFGRRYRGGHSRTYWPIFDSENLAGGGEWVPASTAAAVAMFNLLRGDIAAAGWAGAGALTHGVVEYIRGHTNVLYPSGYYRAVGTPLIPPEFHPILSIAANPRPGTQRRRGGQSA